MDVSELRIDKDEARALWRKYREHRSYHTAQDAEIEKVYKRLAQGKTVIRAFDSIHKAGLGADGLPRLAIARADEREIYFTSRSEAGEFSPSRWGRVARTRKLTVPWPEMTPANKDGKAIVPLIPVHLRPRRGIAQYHILWEANWTAVPKDPYLIRRFTGDAWLVVAAWDLTEVERAAMSTALLS